MAKIGGMELLVILVVALFVIGPERLPKAARTLGRAVASFKKSMNDATSELREVSDDVAAQGYRLKVFDAYRPQQAVDHFVRWAADPDALAMKPYFYPEIDKARLFELGFIAAKSGHSRGSTVDLTL